MLLMSKKKVTSNSDSKLLTKPNYSLYSFFKCRHFFLYLQFSVINKAVQLGIRWIRGYIRKNRILCCYIVQINFLINHIIENKSISSSAENNYKPLSKYKYMSLYSCFINDTYYGNKKRDIWA